MCQQNHTVAASVVHNTDLEIQSSQLGVQSGCQLAHDINVGIRGIDFHWNAIGGCLRAGCHEFINQSILAKHITAGYE